MRCFFLFALMTVTATVSRAADNSSAHAFDLQQRKAAFWCWRPIQKIEPPPVNDPRWVQSPIDRFILSRLEKSRILPASAADRHVLIRRACFDLIGLPPSPAEVEAFVVDPAPDAFAKVVDRLLASDHFGERWARHWMDLARYGETRGHEYDYLIPNAWQYRDYLVRAFNADLPYDQFVTEQIAGDLLIHPRLNPQLGFDEPVLGTGMWLLEEQIHSPVDIRQDEADRMNNRIDMLTKAFLGLTVGCARCHDHKFDAISQKDFYALQGFALSASYRQVPFMSMEQNRRVAEQLDQLRRQDGPALLARLIAAERPGLAQTADYLLAARELLLAGEISDLRVAATAAGGSLDSGTLRGWIGELTRAQVEPDHPLHAFAQVIREQSVRKPPDFFAIASRLRGELKEAPATAKAAEQVLLDFAVPSPIGGWYADGVAFGLRPIRPGELLIGSNPDQPLQGIATRAMARRDPCFADLNPATGNEADAGTLGEWNRSGQSIRTATVTLKSGRLWYLLRGGVRAYAAVDTHQLIAGPLHGSLLREWPADKEGKWRWIFHDLAAYAGERCHVEFSPVGDSPLELGRVIEADQPPAIDVPGDSITAMLPDNAIASAHAWAGAIQSNLENVAGRLAAGTLANSSDIQTQAPAADLIVRRSSLFCASGALRLAFDEAAGKFISGQREIASRIMIRSAAAPALWDGSGVDETVLIRGVAKNRGSLVPRRFLEALGGLADGPAPSDGSGRLQLAHRMIADDNPFTARVMANRVWQHLFGRGIVPTVDNFGVLGQLPTHPELLDYLAEDFRTEQDWSIKKLIRSIMLSSTYQMSSKSAPGADEADAGNLLIHHMPIRRLEAEPIRDELLAVAGDLNAKVGGPPIELNLTEFVSGRGIPPDGPLDGDGRRSVYLRVRRNFLSPMMVTFDMPIPFACVGRRNVSNVPAQALILMNDPLVKREARAWAKRVLAAPEQTPQLRITRMYQAALARSPSPGEIADDLAFLDQQSHAYGRSGQEGLADERTWADLCQVMFNMKEFIFIQ